MHAIGNIILTAVFGALLIAIYGKFSEARPTPSVTTYGGDAGRQEDSLTLLELSLRRVLNEISCQQLNDEQLENKFNSTAATPMRPLLKHISLPSRDGGVVKLHFLDYRLSGSQPNCASAALPRLRLIPSAMPVFPAYYMDWECKNDSSQPPVEKLIENYDLLQKTGTCSTDGTAKWTVIDGSVCCPLKVVRTCCSAT